MITERKFNFTGLIDDSFIPLHQIVAVRSFGDIKAGTVGGWVACDSNLSHDGWSWIGDNAKCHSASVRIEENAMVLGNAEIYGTATISGRAYITGDVNIKSNANIGGTAIIKGVASIANKALIKNKRDFIVITGLGCEYRATTIYKTKDNGLYVCCGCFTGSIEDFLSQVHRKHYGYPKFRKEYELLVKIASVHF